MKMIAWGRFPHNSLRRMVDAAGLSNSRKRTLLRSPPRDQKNRSTNKPSASRDARDEGPFAGIGDEITGAAIENRLKVMALQSR